MTNFQRIRKRHACKNLGARLQGVDLKPAALLAGGSVVGVSIGVLTAVNIPARALKLVIGVIILVSGLTVTLLARRAIRYRSWRMLVLAGVASFNKAASGGGYGPLVTSGQILSGVRTQASVGITSFAEAFTCLLAVALFNEIEKRFQVRLPLATLFRAPTITGLAKALDSRSRVSRPSPDRVIDDAPDDLPLIGKTPAMQALYRLVARVMNTELPVLITGEKGGGRENLAHYIHQLGSREGGFVTLDQCEQKESDATDRRNSTKDAVRHDKPPGGCRQNADRTVLGQECKRCLGRINHAQSHSRLQLGAERGVDLAHIN